jgi:hypothetical protein
VVERRQDAETRGRIVEMIATGRQLIRWVRITFAVVLVGFAVGGYAIVDLIGRNTKAILVSCTLISNVATDAGAAGQSGRSPASRKQQEITALAFDVLIRSMTQAERAKLSRLNAELAVSGGYVKLPNCKQVSEDPESVTQLGTQAKQVPAG